MTSEDFPVSFFRLGGVFNATFTWLAVRFDFCPTFNLGKPSSITTVKL